MRRLATLGGSVARGLRCRALLSGGCVLLLALAIGSAVLGPSFQEAVANSYVISRINAASDTQTGVTVVSRPLTTTRLDPGSTLTTALTRARRQVGRPFSRPRGQLESGRLPEHVGEIQLVAKPGECAHVVLTGRCPARAGEILVLAHDLAYYRWHLGERLDLGMSRGATVRIVGSYSLAPGSSTYWFDPDRFASTPQLVTPRMSRPARLAPFLTTVTEFSRAGTSLWVARTDQRLVLRADATPAVLQHAARLAARFRGQSTVSLLGETAPALNNLPAIVRDVAAQQRTAQRSVAPAVLSVVLVARALLLRLLSAATDLRVPELALATLRGVTRRGRWTLGLAEPVALIVASCPIGLAVGIVGARMLARAWLVPTLPVPLPAASLGAAALVALAALGVAAVTVGSVLRVPLAHQLGGVRRPTVPGRVAVLAGLVLVAATAAIVASRLSAAQPGSPDLTDLVLPVLLAVVAGLGTTRLAAWLAGRLAHRPGRLLPLFVAVRAVARRREGTLVILPVAAALAICVFAIGVYGAAAGWRASVAATYAPSGSVWRSTQPLSQTVALTHRIDPAARWLMATGTIVYPNALVEAVDAPRLARVASWPGDWTPGRSATQVAEAIGPHGQAPSFRGAEISLRLSRHATASAGFYVTLDLTGERAPTQGVVLGPFRPGTTTRSARVPSCRIGCTVAAMAVGGGAGLPMAMSGSVTLERLLVDGRPLPSAFAGAGWAVAPDAPSSGRPTRLVARRGALVVGVQSRSGVVLLAPGRLRTSRPVVLGVRTAAGVGHDRYGAFVDLPDGKLPLHSVLRARSMPFLGPRGLLIDYRMLTTGREDFPQLTTVRVLARAGLPAGLRARLVASGLTEVATQAGVRHTLDQGAYALALRLYAVVAALVLLMAGAGVLVSTAVQLPARRRDAASLRVVGVRRRHVLLALVVEVVTTLGSAAVAGLAAGAFAEYVVVKTVTLGVSPGPAAPTVDAALDWAWLLALLGALAVALVVVATVSALLAVRGARGAVLRENAR